MACYVLLLAAVLGAPPEETAGWRNDGSGRYPNARPPATWDGDSGENVLWKAVVGKGQSTPIVSAEQILLTSEPDQLLALDRASGKVLWKAANGYDALPPGTKRPDKPPPTSPGCGYATPTLVTDGRAIYASFGTGIVASYDREGKRRWIRWLDLPQSSQFGRSASPVLADGKLLVSIGGLEALDPATGATLWQTPEAKPTFGTPAIVRLPGGAVAVTPNGDCVRLSDGKILAKKLGQMEYLSPLVDGKTVYFVGSPTVAVQLPDKLDEGKAERLWSNDDIEGEFFACPVLHEGLLYCASNAGVLTVLDAKSGKPVYTKELEIRSASGKPGSEPANLYPSIVLAGSVLLVSNDAGETLVLAPGRQYKELGRAVLPRGCGASPVPDADRLLLRGGETLYCVGNRAK